LAASLAAQLAGVTGASTAGEVLWALATASSRGIYCDFFILLVCIAPIWPLSRVGTTGAWLARGSCIALTAGFLLALRRLLGERRAREWFGA
jgi:hypothetical protein